MTAPAFHPLPDTFLCMVVVEAGTAAVMSSRTLAAPSTTCTDRHLPMSRVEALSVCLRFELGCQAEQSEYR